MAKITFPKKIVGERIVLKQHKAMFKYAQDLFAVVDKNREHLSHYMLWVTDTKKAEDTFNWILQMRKEWDEKKQAAYGLFLNNNHIGNISVFDVNHDHHNGEIGYWLDKDSVGNGYMTEAVKVLEKEFFDRGLHRMVIKCDEENLPSASVAKRCGYTLEGKQRESLLYKCDVKYKSCCLFSKLECEQ
ncbi:MAG: GNAT family N-acetyltransferase [Alphaproteobacteria bacterium]|nr:GNAT family N-acetyltransferase [Alphaproteobacteria bacterium]